MKVAVNRKNLFATLGALFFMFFISILTGCASSSGLDKKNKSTFVLVHGAFQDASAWSEVKKGLEAKGHQVIAIDLPGRKSDSTPIDQISLQSYRDYVINIIKAQNSPVILVGHSFGGITISNVAEAMPEHIRHLVYVAAYLPKSGDSMAKLSEADQWNKFNKARQNFIVSSDYKTASVLAEDRLMLFCERCKPAAQAKTLALMQKEPLAPAATPVLLTEENFGRVAKSYIATRFDNAVSYQLQKQMIGGTSVEQVYELDTGHSPFFEAPDQLVNVLLKIADESPDNASLILQKR